MIQLFARTSLFLRLVMGTVLVSSSLFALPAAADMLPLVVDHTRNEGPTFWWNSARPNIQSPIDQTLFASDARGIVQIQRKKDFSISRIFQRNDLSVVNAQQIAQLTGATTFFLGKAHAETTEVTWLDSTSAIVTILGDLYDTRSGVLIGSVEIIGRGVSSTRDGAIRLASQAAAQDLRHFQPSKAFAQTAPNLLQIVVHAHDKAQTFVTLHEHFDKAIQGRGVMAPCRASEGEVALCVRSEEDEQQLRGLLLQGLKRGLDNILIDEIQEEEQRIHIYARTPSPEGGSTDTPRPLL